MYPYQRHILLLIVSTFISQENQVCLYALEIHPNLLKRQGLAFLSHNQFFLVVSTEPKTIDMHLKPSWTIRFVEYRSLPVMFW